MLLSVFSVCLCVSCLCLCVRVCLPCQSVCLSSCLLFEPHLTTVLFSYFFSPLLFNPKKLKLCHSSSVTIRGTVSLDTQRVSRISRVARTASLVSSKEVPCSRRASKTLKVVAGSRETSLTLMDDIQFHRPKLQALVYDILPLSLIHI